MKIDVEWVKAAANALTDSKYPIVIKGKYPQAFKGYISSLGGAIAQFGLVPALSILETDNVNAQSDNTDNSDDGNENSSTCGADNNRAYLIYAIIQILRDRGILDLKSGLSLVGEIRKHQSRGLHDGVLKSLVALKLAIRRFEDSEKEVRKGKIKEMIQEDLIFDEDLKEKGPSYEGSNIGWLYYRHLYDGVDKKRIPEKTLKDKIDQMLRFKLDSYSKVVPETYSAVMANEFQSFSLRTIYPGLLIGSGLSHGIKSKEDIKIGFAFDHTTGLPYIPGSSIKGVLETMFPKEKDDKYKCKMEYIRGILKDVLEGTDVEDEGVDSLTKRIFSDSGDGVVFMDAFPKCDEDKGEHKFLGDDFITPHKNPFKSPIPIRFLKVREGVTFDFYFKFSNKLSCRFDNEVLLKLFKRIILDIGLGAKTNVGYGRFEEVRNQS